MAYRIVEVDTESITTVATIRWMNRMAPEIFPELEPRHFDGFWWFAYYEGEVVAFAGLVPNDPYDGYGYLKRAFVLPDHRGHGLQGRFMSLREAKAREIGWTHLVSECGAENRASARNFERAGFHRCFPEQQWGLPGSLYWIKAI